MNSGNIAVDLDGVLLNFNWNSWASKDMNYFGTPMKGGINAIKKLRKSGYRIIVHTCRTNPILNDNYTSGVLYEKVKKILKKNKIPYDEIWMGPGKPIADYYIDDRAIKFENWKQTLHEIPRIIGAKKNAEGFLRKIEE